jgi:hypothetical protein
MFAKIISGGQTGVDRAALDVALELGLPCGGWCPRGRRAENGPIPDRYPLQETASDVYPERTRRNVQEADATLVLLRGEARGGTALTIELAAKHRKPCLVVDLDDPSGLGQVRAWAETYHVQVVNVAGPRESESRRIHDQAVQFLRALLTDDDPLPLPAPGA